MLSSPAVEFIYHTILYSAALKCSKLHKLNNTTLHCTILHNTWLDYTTLCYATPEWITKHCTSQHFSSLHLSVLHCVLNVFTQHVPRGLPTLQQRARHSNYICSSHCMLRILMKRVKFSNWGLLLFVIITSGPRRGCSHFDYLINSLIGKWD